jgi:HD-GYP domain-containing protein (c-di-GMP phosphodiesterase class II)
VKLLLRNRENVVCRSTSNGRIKSIQFRALYENNRRFWEHQERWEYFLERQVAHETDEQLRILREALERRRVAGDGSGDQSPEDTGPMLAPADPEPAVDELPETDEALSDEGHENFSSTYAKYKRLDQDDRVKLLKDTTNHLNDLARKEDLEGHELASALVDATQDATMANRAALLEALRLGNDQAKAYTQQMVIETHQMVRSTIRLVDSDVYNDELVRAVVERSNGTVVQHMTRVFLSGLEFLLFYNREVMTRGIANRIRVRFPREYKKYYRTLLPHLHEDYVSLEHVFLGGMKALTEVEINKYATGFLVHDVGKAEDIEYHEGDAAYDRETVERHVKLGYRAVMDKTNYPREAALITGFHHEYYGHDSGYGYFREFLRSYKEANPALSQDYVMAYTMEPVIDYQVLSYFPAKMLEIVDVFDSLTDPNRKYRSPLLPQEAIDLMRNEFIEKQLKIDPVLFDLFVEFYHSRWNTT